MWFATLTGQEVAYKRRTPRNVQVATVPRVRKNKPVFRTVRMFLHATTVDKSADLILTSSASNAVNTFNL